MAVSPVTPSSESAFFTSSSLNGLMIASTFFTCHLVERPAFRSWRSRPPATPGSGPTRAASGGSYFVASDGTVDAEGWLAAVPGAIPVVGPPPKS